MAYSNKVVDHYENPRNVGSLPKDDVNVGTGLVGAPECGDVMKLQVKVNPETGVIDDAKFKTFGCGSAIASSSLATEWLKGKTVDQALAIKNTEIVAELSLPPVKIHCSVLAEEKIRSLMAKQGITEGGLRVGVKGGGCSGLSYTFAWEREPRLGDEVFEGPEGAKIFIDRKSYLFLNGTTLDYDTALLSTGFVFHNPNAKTTCGCGSSFGA